MFGQVRRGGDQDADGTWVGNFVDRRLMVICEDELDTVLAMILIDNPATGRPDRGAGDIVRITKSIWPKVEE